jgi:hypothetical protein
MKRRDHEDSANYTLGVTGAWTVIAFFRSIIQSKALTLMFFVGSVAIFSFLYFLFSG